MVLIPLNSIDLFFIKFLIQFLINIAENIMTLFQITPEKTNRGDVTILSCEEKSKEDINRLFPD